MQKKLIAAAIAGLVAVPALAQTNVTISGRFAAGWESYKLSGGGNTGHDAESRVSDQSSRIIFNVVEDLGGGLKAWGQLDARFAQDLGGNVGGSPATGGKAATTGGAIGTAALNTWASGNTGMGLMHPTWGKFTIGRWDVHYNELAKLEATRAGSLQSIVSFGLMSQVTFDPTAAAGGNVTTMGKGTRTDNLLMWDSPNWNGFTARLGYSTGQSGNEGNTNRAAGNPGGGRMWTGALRYDNGPWTAGISYWNNDSESRVTGAARLDGRSTRAWLGYTFGMGLKVAIAWDGSKIDDSANGAAGAANAGSARRHAWMIPVSYSFGPHAVYFNYARAGGLSGSNVAPGMGGGTGANQWMLGYDYAFSKRTSAGVYYTKLNNGSRAAYDMFGLGANGATPTMRGEDARQWYFGLAHNF